MKRIFFIIFYLLMVLGVWCQNTGSFTDPRDEKKYKTIKIGTQTWMAENLNFKTDNDSWCYENKPENCDVFGRLYGWDASKTACPKGWHLPTKAEMDVLIKYVGGEGPEAFKKLYKGGSSGFEALLGGSCGDQPNVKWYDNGAKGYFRINTEPKDYADFAWYLNVSGKSKMVILFMDYRSDGVSVRCLKDK